MLVVSDTVPAGMISPLACTDSCVVVWSGGGVELTDDEVLDPGSVVDGVVGVSGAVVGEVGVVAGVDDTELPPPVVDGGCWVELGAAVVDG